jgi:hypothetical protein
MNSVHPLCDPTLRSRAVNLLKNLLLWKTRNACAAALSELLDTTEAHLAGDICILVV